ncbi:MAG: twitching motility protein PilT, partial [Caldilineaceae bacterium]|nr:twitching motility protein PilT [Caldilineaceae bacterium]
MLAVTFRFYGNLNDFLPGDRRNTLIEQRMADHAAVKHPIETLGIPHTEVGAILVNRQAVDFAYRLDDGDRVEAYPP